MPQAPREIWAALAAAGFQSSHNDPPSAVRNALKRRMKTHDDVFVVGDGKWARKDFYTEEQLVEIRKSVGGMGGRDRVEHTESTKAGMIVARQRGARIGQPKWFTEEREAGRQALQSRRIGCRDRRDVGKDAQHDPHTLQERAAKAASSRSRVRTTGGRYRRHPTRTEAGQVMLQINSEILGDRASPECKAPRSVRREAPLGTATEAFAPSSEAFGTQAS